MKTTASGASTSFVTPHEEKLVSCPISTPDNFNKCVMGLLMTFISLMSKDHREGNPYKLGPINWVYSECIKFMKSDNAVEFQMD